VSLSALQLAPSTLAEMLGLIADGTISGKIGKDLLPDLLQAAAAEGGVAALVAARGLSQLSDETAIRALIQTVLDANPKQLAELRGGKTKLQGFFQGQVMKESGGRVNPGMLAKLLPQMLAA